MPNRGIIRMKDIERTAGRFDIDLAGHGRLEGRFGLCRPAVRALRRVALLRNCLDDAGDRATERARRVARRRPLIDVVVDTSFYRMYSNVPDLMEFGRMGSATDSLSFVVQLKCQEMTIVGGSIPSHRLRQYVPPLRVNGPRHVLHSSDHNGQAQNAARAAVGSCQR